MIFDYAISTYRGTVLNTIKTDYLPKKPFIVYIDDLYFKHSYFTIDFQLNLNEFLKINNDIILKFRHEGYLHSNRGRYNISKIQYNEFIQKAKPTVYQSYDRKQFSNGEFYYEPLNLNDFLSNIGVYRKFSTDFINEISKSGRMLTFEGDVLDTAPIFECGQGCCAKLYPGYLTHLWDTKEISALTYIVRHNFTTLDRFFGYLNDQ